MMKPLRFASLLLLAAGCGTYDAPVPCGQIPDEGCPIGRGGTCDDHLCSALYDCAQGAWTLVVECENGSGGAGGGGGSGGGGGAGGSCEPVKLDKTGETAGCKPDLQNPDCPAAAAETCLEAACLTDCSDFFLCTKDGWKDVAYCDADGKLVILGASAKRSSP